jgi:hypothetical protein
LTPAGGFGSVPDMTTKQILIAARALLVARGRHAKRTYFDHKTGCFCSTGAIGRAAGLDFSELFSDMILGRGADALTALWSALPDEYKRKNDTPSDWFRWEDIIYFNDHNDFDVVIAAFDRAIESL